MANLDLRPLSLGELLDRTFTLYRQHFALFVGISAIPHLLVLALNLANTLASTGTATPRQGQLPSTGLMAGGVVVAILGIAIYLIVYLFAQGGTFFAVSEIYLGRTTTIGASLRRMRGKVLKLLGVTILNGLAVGAATILLIIPGIYMLCRLMACVPAALFEDLGPGESLSRSFDLTKNEAGRAFVIWLLYFVLAIVAATLFEFPFSFMAGLAVRQTGSPAQLWTALMHVGNFLGTVLVTPYLTIATAVFYYDLRVRKEAFDLQLMMNAGAAVPAPAPGAPPSLA